MRTNSYRVKHRSNRSAQSNILNIVLTVLRIIFGCVFIFSGFVKLIDPLGFTYKIEDYLTAFGGFFTYFIPLALPASMLLSTLEFVIGLNMVFKVRYQLTTMVALLVMVFMTGLTLYTAIANPVSDCGCFGDAIIISNTATFIKNIFLLAIIIFLFITRKNSFPVLTPALDWTICILFFAVGIGLSVHSYRYLPMFDFRPYKVGVNIPEAMQTPEGYPQDEYETTFIYEKDGVRKEFSLQNYPKNDSTWVFVDQKSVLVSKGYEPPIHDFSMVDEYMYDVTEDILSQPEDTYLLIAYDINKASKKGLINAQKIYNRAVLSGKNFYALSASSQEEIEQVKLDLNLSYTFYQTDPITLKTIIRSNPGLLLIKNGTIEAKWPWRNFDEVKD